MIAEIASLVEGVGESGVTDDISDGGGVCVDCCESSMEDEEDANGDGTGVGDAIGKGVDVWEASTDESTL